MAESFVQRAYAYYMQKGLPSHQAAALAAQADQESGGNPAARGDGGQAFGIFQWHPDRQANLQRFAKENGRNPGDMATQLDFALHELKTTEKAAGDKLFGAKDYREAIDAGMAYLRPSGYRPDAPQGGHNYSGRFNAGASLVGAQPIMGNAIAAAGSADTPVTPTSGLLAGGLDTTKLDQLRAEQATAQAAATKEKEQEQAYASLTKQGLGLLEQGQKVEPVVAPPPLQPMAPQQAGVAEQHQFLTMPDFEKMLAQQRLGRRIA